MGILDREAPSQEFDHEVYYSDHQRLDLNKVRKEAEDRQRGDYYKGPESTRLHFHRHGEPCKEHVHEQWGVRG